MQQRFSPIADYAIIGDCRSAALISREGSLDWLCWPRFDSSSLFAAILDPDIGGSWKIHPRDVIETSRAYVPGTNVLQTTLTTRSGQCVLTECMPVGELGPRCAHLADHEILRKVECISGEVLVVSHFTARPVYATERISIRDRKLGLEFDYGVGECWFRCSRPQQVHDSDVHGEFRLTAGETLWFSLTYTDVCPSIVPPLCDAAEARLQDSIEWWQQWSSRLKYEGEWRGIVERSALALKLMTYSPSGAVIAAPTTSLPERIGGSLNWDYRYCWLRDASLTTRAMLGLGYIDEAAAFIDWMLNTTALTLPSLNVLYDVFGERPDREKVLPHFRGYCDSRPVRVGNAAADQCQLDVYGEVLDGVAQFVYAGGELDRTSQRAIIDIGKYVCQHWNEPDDGIWEPRAPRKHHTHSRLLCWVAMDRILNMEKQGKLGLARVPSENFRLTRQKIRRQILDEAWNEDLGAYASILGGHQMDSALLLLAWYGFETPESPRMLATYWRIVRELRAGEDLLYRYATYPHEGAFGICSFWEADYLALGGADLETASQRFRGLLRYANDVGLYAEEIDPRTGAAVGNFPQAFTHVGLIDAALSLRERACGERQLPHREPAETQSEKVA